MPHSSFRRRSFQQAQHKAIYFAIHRNHETGVDLIENGVMYEHVRVCRSEPGVVDDCPIK